MLIRFVGGEERLSFKIGDKSLVFSCLARLDVPFREVIIGEESFSLLIPFYRRKSIEKSLFLEGIEFQRLMLKKCP